MLDLLHVCCNVCFGLSCSIHPPVIYCLVWHQVLLLHAVPVKVYDVAFYAAHWQQRTHACTRAAMTTRFSAQKIYTDAVGKRTLLPQSYSSRHWLNIAFAWKEHLMSDCIFLSPVCEKR